VYTFFGALSVNIVSYLVPGLTTKRIVFELLNSTDNIHVRVRAFEGNVRWCYPNLVIAFLG
jgi:hypothetical protein